MSIHPLVSGPSLDTIVQSIPTILTISFTVLALTSYAAFNSSKFPLANNPGWCQTSVSKRIEFARDGRRIFQDAKKRYGPQPFRLLTEIGEVLVLPPSYANMIRNDMNLSTSKALEVVKVILCIPRVMLTQVLEFSRQSIRL
jgi:hypothetical protein